MKHKSLYEFNPQKMGWSCAISLQRKWSFSYLISLFLHVCLSRWVHHFEKAPSSTSVRFSKYTLDYVAVSEAISQLILGFIEKIGREMSTSCESIEVKPIDICMISSRQEFTFRRASLQNSVRIPVGQLTVGAIYLSSLQLLLNVHEPLCPPFTLSGTR